MSTNLTRTIADEVAPLLRKALASELLTPAQVEEVVLREIAKLKPSLTRVKLVLPSGESRDVGRQHEKFGLLARLLHAGLPVWIVGPAGSGKTTAVEAVAKSLDLAFYSRSCGPHMTEASLLGYMDATGTYRRTCFRDCYESGGVMLLDEVDRSNPAVLTCLNQAISNGTCAFPDGMICRHPEARFVACANTYGMGANRQYVGALQLDASTLDRFVMLDWPYDPVLELDLALSVSSAKVAGPWVKFVQVLRARADANSIRHIISPRASIFGAILLSLDIPRPVVIALTLRKGLDDDTWEKLTRGIL